jgi:hypothetical protein
MHVLKSAAAACYLCITSGVAARTIKLRQPFRPTNEQM